MAAGFRGLLAWMMAWHAGTETARVAGPYRVAAGDVWHAGAAAGQTFTTGSRAGDVWHTGAAAGQTHA